MKPLNNKKKILSKKIFIIKYILKKIQNQEWEYDKAIPSERWLAIKFEVSKSLISGIIAIFKAYNIIYSVAHYGNFVSKSNSSFLYSQTLNDKNLNSKVNIFADWVFSKNDKDFLNIIEIKDSLLVHAFSDNYITFQKDYYNDESIYEKIIIILPQKYKHHIPSNSKELLKKSIYSFTSFINASLCNWASAQKNSKNLKSNNIKYFTNFPNDAIVNTTYKIFYDEEKEAQVIIKIMKIVELDLYSSITISKLF